MSRPTDTAAGARRPLRAWLALALLVAACAEEPAPPGADAGGLDAGADLTGDVANDPSVGDLDHADDAPVDDQAADGSDLAYDALPDWDVPWDAVDLGADASPDLDAAGDGAGPDARGPCEPALRLEPEEAWRSPNRLLSLRPSGGTGAYRFDLADDQSGALVNALTGSYLAGAALGATDTVRLSDEGCVGEASARVHVVAPMAVAPEAVELSFGTGFTFETTGGSGRVAFALESSGSGGEVGDDGAYQAGASAGTDVVRVSDTETGDFVDAVIRVREQAPLSVWPARVAIPLGGRFQLRPSGGSGHLAISGGRRVVGLEGADVLVGREAGTVTLEVRDRFGGQRVDLDVTVVEGQRAELPRAGDRFDWTRLIGPGDLDGDGYTDAILALSEADVSGANAGAVYVYRGGPDGLGPGPAQVLAGRDRNDWFGRDVAVGDLDGDGELDLVVGAPLSDLSGGNSGTVEVFRGIAGGLFEAEPTWRWAGVDSNDWFGHSVAVCDIDGDGHLDVAVGAERAEDSSLAERPSDTGALLVFRNEGGSFGLEPAAVVHGVLPDGGGGWSPASSLRLGNVLVAGDRDGDGACDLSSSNYAWDSATGVVVTYRGVPAAEGPGVLEATPAEVVIPDLATDPEARIGRRLAAGDLNGDGRDELVLSGYYHRDGDTVRTGGVAILWGQRRWSGAAAYRELTEGDWFWVGDDAYDYAGYAVEVSHWDGDGRADLVVGSWQDEVVDGPAGVGTAAVFVRDDEGLPSSPSFAVGGSVAGEFFGEAVAAIGDADGDGTGDLLVYSAGDGSLGTDVGLPYFVSGRGESGSLGLELPGEASNQWFGWRAAIVGDLDRDGFAELAIGAPLLDLGGSYGRDSGAVFVYAGGRDGFEREPTTTLQGFRGFSASDWVGYDVADAGDFDGDGISDLAVVARFEDRPASFPAPGYANPDECPYSRGNSGAVFVFRGSGDASLVEAEPAFVYYGPDDGQGILSVAGGFDVDGDGRGDIAVGSPNWDAGPSDNGGGFAVLTGRPAAPGATTVICDEHLLYRGAVGGDNVGNTVSGLGDLDGDGCDEVAAGAYVDDRDGLNNQGSVRVVMGWGGPGCHGVPREVVLASGAANSQFGYSLAGGHDVDGDGVPDLIVGATAYRGEGMTPGAAILLSGSWIAAQPTSEAVGTGAAPTVYVTDEAARRIEGTSHDEQLGRGVGLVPGLDGARAGVVVGSPLGSADGTFQSGGAAVWAWSPEAGAFESAPHLVLGGESFRQGSRLGELAVGGTLSRGRPAVVVTTWQGSSHGLDQGSAYVFEVSSGR